MIEPPEPRPSEEVSIDFHDRAERAAELRLAGDLAGAAAIYIELTEMADDGAKGYGFQHLAIVNRNLADRSWEAGDQETSNELLAAADHYLGAAGYHYSEAGDVVRESAVMLDRAMLLKQRGQLAESETEIRASLGFMAERWHKMPDYPFRDEHLGIKHARLAEVLAAQGKTTEARKRIASARRVPQRNPYFRMLTDQIDGSIAAKTGDREVASRCLGAALVAARELGDTRRITEITALREQLG